MKSLYGIIFIICLTTFLDGCRKNKDISAYPKDEVIDFRLDTLNHERFYLNQHRGKVVVLAFWATWCNICKSELVELKSLAAMPEYKNIIIAAVCNDPENIDYVKTIINSLDVNYPVLLDENAKVSKKLRIAAVPTTIVIDQAGKCSLIRQGYGADTVTQIKKNIDALLASEKSN